MHSPRKYSANPSAFVAAKAIKRREKPVSMEEYDIMDSTVRLAYQPLCGLVKATDAHKQNSVMWGFDPQHNQRFPVFTTDCR